MKKGGKRLEYRGKDSHVRRVRVTDRNLGSLDLTGLPRFFYLQKFHLRSILSPKEIGFTVWTKAEYSFVSMEGLPEI